MRISEHVNEKSAGLVQSPVIGNEQEDQSMCMVKKMLEQASIGAESALLAALMNAVAITSPGSKYGEVPFGAKKKMSGDTAASAARYVTGVMRELGLQPTKVIVDSKAAYDANKASPFYWSHEEFTTRQPKPNKSFNKSIYKYVLILRHIASISPKIEERELLQGLAEQVHEYLTPFEIMDGPTLLADHFRMLASKTFARSRSHLHTIHEFARVKGLIWNEKEKLFEAMPDEPFFTVEEMGAAQIHLCFRDVAVGVVAMVSGPLSQKAIADAIAQRLALRYAVVEQVTLILLPDGDKARFVLKATPLTVYMGNPGDDAHLALSSVASYQYRLGTPFGHPHAIAAHRLIAQGEPYFRCPNYKDHYDHVFHDQSGGYAPEDVIGFDRNAPVTPEILELWFGKSRDERWLLLKPGSHSSIFVPADVILPESVDDNNGRSSTNILERLATALQDGSIEKALKAKIAEMFAAMNETENRHRLTETEKRSAFRSKLIGSSSAE